MSTCNTCAYLKDKSSFFRIFREKTHTVIELQEHPCFGCRYLFDDDRYEENLKKCPFCGSMAHIQSNTWGDTDRESYSVICGNPKCEMETGWFDTKKEAIEFWNRRV